MQSSSLVSRSHIRIARPSVTLRKAGVSQYRNATVLCRAHLEGGESLRHVVASRIAAGVMGLSLALGSTTGSVAQAIPIKSFEIVPLSDMRGISKITITVESDDAIAAAENDELGMDATTDGPAIVVETVAQDEIVDAEPEVIVAIDDALEEEPEATVALDEEISDAVVEAVVAAEEEIPEPEVAVAEVEVVADEGIPEAEVVVAETSEAELAGAEAIVADVVVEEVAEPNAVQVASAASLENEVAEIAATEEPVEDEVAEIAATEEDVELEVAAEIAATEEDVEVEESP